MASTGRQGPLTLVAQERPAALTQDQVRDEPRLSERTRLADSDSVSTSLEAVAAYLRTLARQLDGLCEIDMGAGEFVQLDMAARNALAAAHAMEAACGSSLIRIGPRHPVRITAPDVEPMHPELALSLVKRLFAAGLHLTALQALLGQGALSDKVGTVVEQLDLVIKELRLGVVDESSWEAG